MFVLSKAATPSGRFHAFGWPQNSFGLPRSGVAKTQGIQRTTPVREVPFRIDAAALSYSGQTMEGFRLKRFAAAGAATGVFGALLLCLPMVVLAQDAQPAPTPAPVLTDPSIPGDFSLPPSDNTPEVVGPTRPGDVRPRQQVVPQAAPAPAPSPSAAPSRQAQVQGEVRRPAPNTTPTPRADSPARSVDQPQTQQTAPVAATPETAETPSDSGDATLLPQDGIAAQSAPENSVAEAVAAEGNSGNWPIAIALLAAFLLGTALFVFLRLRRPARASAGAEVASPQVERPIVSGGGTAPLPAPASVDQPKPVAAGVPPPVAPASSGLVQSRVKASPRRDDSGHVTVRSPRASQPVDGLVTARTSGSGLVTTNLAQKRREQAEAAQKRSAPRPVPVKRNISFDWN